MHVISHTHWDREWYLTFQQFRLRLVDLVDHFFNIMDEPVPDGRVAIPGARRVRLVNLNEEPQEEWREEDNLSMDVGPKKIVTVEFEGS